jgi:hypothetical protein
MESETTQTISARADCRLAAAEEGSGCDDYVAATEKF